MWGAYHQLRTARTFVEDWDAFLSMSIRCKALPAFCQFVTHYIFKKLIKTEYALTNASPELSTRSLSHIEQNALRYVAGYVLRKVRNQLEASSHPKKDEMVLLVMECAGDEFDENCGTETWTNMVDRGGLWHINDQTYSLFVIMEEELRQHYTLGKSGNTKDSAIKAILQSNDLLFEWCIIASEADDDIATQVLQRIVQLYITIRGFAFATSCLDMYKQAHKKTLQKKKALRSDICQ